MSQQPVPRFKLFNALLTATFLLVSFPLSLQSESKHVFESTDRQTLLLELYTSEGCSSCPPADRWLSELKNDDQLWKNLVPVAFHVDYWDYIGWKDPFARREYTQRQRAYAALWRSDTIYTPGFVLNGREWRNWRRARPMQPRVLNKPGTIEATVEDKSKVQVLFHPRESENKKWIAHIAVLGMDRKSNVTAGENRGRDLKHDFVALEWEYRKMRRKQDFYSADLFFSSTKNERDLALAIWITSDDDPYPIQATGGYLD